ncbi:type I restriction endonuclease [Garciella nitratireducens]|uniref:Restriction endonuclease type I HsdR N-terminal domain-containing protein n=1 Tax=Garciella nitratireducens DSM 15102 TaxID=1121911 RepID=A0A1T4K7I8_9FIRM|nr:type I restriction endonuclease [Garciella nitratireducens]SJZ38392.1 hypothetical protein SAMN02745973_00399 [Garciella nitratireducens DSM 15102]
MNFEEQIKSFAERTRSIKDGIETEEATKTSLIMPLFQILGYDIFNPLEFTPEYTADVGIKKGEKVDYAILQNKEPIIFIEAKSINETLTKHDSQLFRYFGTTTAKFAILTNGLIYRFYTDLDEPNKMDETPFLEINMLELKDAQIQELKKFHKDNFDLDRIIDTASELKYMGLIRSALKEIFSNPSDDYVRFILGCGVYEGIKTQNVIDRFKPLVKKSITSYINDLVNEKIQIALKSEEEPETKVLNTEEDTEVNAKSDDHNEIITTEDEIESFFIIKSILRNHIDISRVTYKDNKSYFGVLIDNKVTKWICRLFLKDNVMYMIIQNENKENIKYSLEKIDDIYNYSEVLIEKALSYIN